MSTPSNPGWTLGFVPTPAQWNAAFSAKVDYPAPIGQGGTGATNTASAEYNLAQRALISTTPYTLAPITWYGIKTATAAITLNLPAISSLGNADWIDVADVDFNANANNITITGNGTDHIVLYGTSAVTQTVNVAGTKLRLVVNGSAWRMLV